MPTTTNTNATSLRRILLVRNDRVGDLVLTLPAIEAVRRAWPQAKISLLASSYAAPLVAGHSLIDALLADKPSDHPFRLAQKLRAMRYDAAIVFNANTRNCLAVWAAGIRRRVCWAYKPLAWLSATDRVTLRRSHPPVHEAEFALAFARKLGAQAELSQLTPHLEINPATRERIVARITRELGTAGPLFGVHPGNHHSAFNWPASRYAQLVCQLAPFGRVMVTGTPHEQPDLDLIRRRLSAPQAGRVGFFTDFSLPELAAAIAEQTVLVVSSTGPMHIAGIVGTPTVALFSPHPAHAPAKWAPLGTNHTLLTAPREPLEPLDIPTEQGADIMARIRVEQVLRSALAYASRELVSGAA